MIFVQNGKTFHVAHCARSTVRRTLFRDLEILCFRFSQADVRLTIQAQSYPFLSPSIVVERCCPRCGCYCYSNCRPTACDCSKFQPHPADVSNWINVHFYYGSSLAFVRPRTTKFDQEILNRRRQWMVGRLDEWIVWCIFWGRFHSKIQN